MNQNKLETIFRKGAEGKRRFSPINNTWERFSFLCKEVINNSRDFKATNIHVGFWIPKNWEVPLRLPVILVPALEIMRWLLREWITPPHFIVYQATSIISQINDIEVSEASNTSRNMENRILSFIQESFPELLEYITLSFWCKNDDLEILETIRAYAWSTSELLAESSKSHFQSCEARNSNWSWKSLLYATANSYYNGWFEQYPFSEASPANTIIPIWWRSETECFKLLLETQMSCRDIFPLITQLGTFPTYYKNLRWDIMTETELSQYDPWNTDLHPDIQKDLKVLSNYTQ